MSKVADSLEKKTSLEKPKSRPRQNGTRLFGEANDKMLVENKQPGWHYVFVEDAGINLQEAQAAGYEFVRKDDPEIVASDDVTGTSGRDMSNYVSRVVNRFGTINYLMRIPEEWWLEDEAVREEQRNSQSQNKLDEARFAGEVDYKNSIRVGVGKGRR